MFSIAGQESVGGVWLMAEVTGDRQWQAESNVPRWNALVGVNSARKVDGREADNTARVSMRAQGCSSSFQGR